MELIRYFFPIAAAIYLVVAALRLCSQRGQEDDARTKNVTKEESNFTSVIQTEAASSRGLMQRYRKKFSSSSRSGTTIRNNNLRRRKGIKKRMGLFVTEDTKSSGTANSIDADSPNHYGIHDAIDKSTSESVEESFFSVPAPSNPPTNSPFDLSALPHSGQPFGSPIILRTNTPSNDPSLAPEFDAMYAVPVSPTGLVAPSPGPSLTPSTIVPYVAVNPRKRPKLPLSLFIPRGRPARVNEKTKEKESTPAPSNSENIFSRTRPADGTEELLFEEPTLSLSVSISSSPSNPPSSVSSDDPSIAPSDELSNLSSDEPSILFSDKPSDIPSDSPSTIPSDRPSNIPSDGPSNMPSDEPSNIPSDKPSVIPSDKPSDIPSDSPSTIPSDRPSNMPSDGPSNIPSDKPSVIPSDKPSDIPSDSPSTIPSDRPSTIPSDRPSTIPSDRPSTIPSDVPSNNPSESPSDGPFNIPSGTPSNVLSSQPSDKLSNTPSERPSIEQSGKPSIIPPGLPSGGPSEIFSSEPTNAPTSVSSLSLAELGAQKISEAPSFSPPPSEAPSFSPPPSEAPSELSLLAKAAKSVGGDVDSPRGTPLLSAIRRHVAIEA